MALVTILDLNNPKDQILYLEVRISSYRANLNRTLEMELALLDAVKKLEELKSNEQK